MGDCGSSEGHGILQSRWYGGTSYTEIAVAKGVHLYGAGSTTDAEKGKKKQAAHYRVNGNLAGVESIIFFDKLFLRSYPRDGCLQNGNKSVVHGLKMCWKYQACRKITLSCKPIIYESLSINTFVY